MALTVGPFVSPASQSPRTESGAVQPAPSPAPSSSVDSAAVALQKDSFEAKPADPKQAELLGSSAPLVAICMGPDRKLAVATMSGPELLDATNKWGAAQDRKPAYYAAIHDPAIAQDAKAYLSSDGQARAAADRMLGQLPSGLSDAQRQRWESDFAVGHFISEGRAAGLSWPGGTVDKVSALAQVANTPAPVEPHRVDTPNGTITVTGERSSVGVITQFSTEGRTGITVATAVAAGNHTVVTMDGRNNELKFCSNPYPSYLGRGDAILGGANNRGEADLVGTVLVRAGEGNHWQLKDPSVRVPTGSGYHDLARDRLAEGAQRAQVVLEGSASDWTISQVGRGVATYTNRTTGTRVDLPESARDQVTFRDSTSADALARELRKGSTVGGAPAPAGGTSAPVTGTGTASPSVSPGPGSGSVGGAGGVGGSAPAGGASGDALVQELLAAGLENALMEALGEALGEAMARALLKSLFKELLAGKLKGALLKELKSLLEKANEGSEVSQELRKLLSEALAGEKRRPVTFSAH